jgi:uncharacterized protein YraI
MREGICQSIAAALKITLKLGTISTMSRIIFLLPILFSLLAGCSFSLGPQETPTPTPVPFYTATLLPTFTPHPSATYAPPTITPTIQPLEATTNAQVNVRSGPDQTQPSLGLINFGTKVQIIGKDAAEKWWRIVYADTPSGVGWVSMGFITFNGDPDDVPVIDTNAQPPTPAPGETSAPTLSPTPKARTASVTEKINVRSGPATSNESLGMIEANTTVVLTGRNEINTWVQIEFADGPDGKGWVAALYLKDPDLKGLAYYDNQGKLIYAPTPDPFAGSGQPSPTPTGYIPAPPDNDSEDAPGVKQTLSSSGAGTLIYTSELSSPTGDDVDWVAFTLDIPANQSAYLYLRLDCTGNGGVTTTLEKDGQPVADTRQLMCGNYDLAIKVIGQQEYVLVLRADPSGDAIRYVSYKLTIEASP